MESTEASDKVVAGGVSERPPREERDARPRPITLFRNGAYVSLGVLAVIAAAAAVYTARGVLIQVLIALFVAISLDPAVRMLTRRGVRRGLAVLLIFVVALGLVAAFLVAVIPALVHQFQVLVHNLPDYLAQPAGPVLAFPPAEPPVPPDQPDRDLPRKPPRRARQRAARAHQSAVRRAGFHADGGGAHDLLHARPAPPAPRPAAAAAVPPRAGSPTSSSTRSAAT